MKIYKIANTQQQVVRFTCPITGMYVDGLRENGKFLMFLLYAQDGSYIDDKATFNEIISSAKNVEKRCNISKSGKLAPQEST